MIGNVQTYFNIGHELWRKSTSADAFGGTVETYAKQADLTGRLRPLSGDLKLSAEKHTSFSSHRFYCLPVDIRPGDQIRSGGRVYEVQGAFDLMTMGRLMQVDVSEVV